MGRHNKISVIIPVYNTEKYLGRCIDSLINQTYKNIEILIVDDGSQDNSSNIIREYAGKYPHIRSFTQKNQGTGAARNIGLKNASGDYIMFCDSDDTFEPDMCEEMLLTICEQHTDLVMCNTRIHKMQEDSFVAKVGSHEFPFKSGRYNSNPECLDKIDVHVWNKIFKKPIINRFNISSPNLRYSEDNVFTYQYLSVIDNLYLINKPLYNYFENISSASYKFNSNQIQISSIYDKIYTLELFYNFLNKNNIFIRNSNFFIKVFKRQIQYIFLNIGNAWEASVFEKIGKLLNKIELKDYGDHDTTFLVDCLKNMDFEKSAICLERIVGSQLNTRRAYLGQDRSFQTWLFLKTTSHSFSVAIIAASHIFLLQYSPSLKTAVRDITMT